MSPKYFVKGNPKPTDRKLNMPRPGKEITWRSYDIVKSKDRKWLDIEVEDEYLYDSSRYAGTFKRVWRNPKYVKEKSKK